MCPQSTIHLICCLNYNLFIATANSGTINPAAKHLSHRRRMTVSPSGSAPVSASFDCLLAEQGCIQQQSCKVLYHLLEYCSAEEAISPLGPDARNECLEAQNSLQRHRPLQVCKCQRGSRREEHCLRVYWTVRFGGGI